MSGKAYFYIDDVIWLMRELTRKPEKTLFDNPFMGMLRRAHEAYGLKVQLNLFYRTDPFYGPEEFTLAQMTDRYRSQWEENAHWIKMSFHARQEFPDYPYLNASYDEVKNDYLRVKEQVLRFASEKNWCRTVNPHWRPMSRAGCHALVDCGVKLICATTGEKVPYNGNPASLPYGHAARLLQNRTPEAGTFIRRTKDLSILNSLCSYNHLTEAQLEDTLHTLGYYTDAETGIHIKTFLTGPLHNASKLEDIREEMLSHTCHEFIGWCTHEQYFYPEYYAYQPDYAQKLYTACQVLQEQGYEFFFVDELV